MPSNYRVQRPVHTLSDALEAIQQCAFADRICADGFGINVVGGQWFQASPPNPSGEASRQQGGPDEDGDCGIEDVEIVCHGALSEWQGATDADSRDTVAFGGS